MDVKPDFSAAVELRPSNKLPGKKPAASVPAAENASGLKQTATELIEEIVRRNRNFTTVAMLEEATGFKRTKIYAVTSRLRQQGRISYVDQGVYGPP